MNTTRRNRQRRNVDGMRIHQAGRGILRHSHRHNSIAVESAALRHMGDLFGRDISEMHACLRAKGRYLMQFYYGRAAGGTTRVDDIMAEGDNPFQSGET